jgi:hypothetical protein
MAVLSVAVDRTTSLPADGFLAVTGMSAEKRRTPSVVVREPRTAPMSAEDRQQAVTALVAVIHERWSDGQGRSAGAVGGSDQRGAPVVGGDRWQWPLPKQGRTQADSSASCTAAYATGTTTTKPPPGRHNNHNSPPLDSLHTWDVLVEVTGGVALLRTPVSAEGRHRRHRGGVAAVGRPPRPTRPHPHRGRAPAATRTGAWRSEDPMVLPGPGRRRVASCGARWVGQDIDTICGRSNN